MENSRPRNKEAENNDPVGGSGNNIFLDPPTSATTSSKPTEHFSVADDLQKLLDESKQSSQSTSFLGGSLKTNSVFSILNDKTIYPYHNSQIENGSFRSREKSAFDLEVSDKSLDKTKSHNTGFNSFNTDNEKVTAILSSEFFLEDSKEIGFASESENNSDTKYSQPKSNSNTTRTNQGVSNLSEPQFVDSMDTGSYVFEDGEDVLRLLENPSEDFFDDLYSDPEFASKELREFEEFIKLKYNCLPENVTLDNDITDYVDSPDYLEDVYGLPELYEYLKKPKSSGVSIHRIKALERLTSIKAHLEKAHL